MKLTVVRCSPEEAGENGPALAGNAAVTEVTYEVPEYEGMTVLDGLNWLREHVDPSLSFRFSCRRANACKECVALVNGKLTYTCTVPATGEIRVAPVPTKLLLRDLSVELEGR